MSNDNNQKLLKILNNSRIKAIIAAVLFHVVYSFIFGMLIGDKNSLIFLYEKDYIIAYMILMPIFASLPYIISGYLITLGRNDRFGLKLKNTQLMVRTLIVIISIYVIVYALQYFYPYRNAYNFYIFLNYPAASYLISMEKAEYAQNLLVLISVIMPAFMTFIGGLLRIRIQNRGD